MVVEFRPKLYRTKGIRGFRIPFNLEGVEESSNLEVYRDNLRVYPNISMEDKEAIFPSTEEVLEEETITFLYRKPIVQELVYPIGGTIRAKRIEKAYDNITEICQSLKSRVDMVVKTQRSGGAVIQPLQANKLLVVQGDGVIGFSEGSIYEIDDFLRQIEVIGGGVEGLIANENINKTAEIISDVEALGAISSEILAVHSNKDNVIALAKMADLIRIAARKAQEFKNLADNGVRSYENNLVKNGDFKYQHVNYDDRPAITTYYPCGMISVGYLNVNINSSVKNLEFTISSDDEFQTKNKIRVQRFGEILNSEFNILSRISWSEGVRLDYSKRFTAGIKVKTGPNFSGSIKLLYRFAHGTQITTLTEQMSVIPTARIVNNESGSRYLITDPVLISGNEDRDIATSFDLLEFSNSTPRLISLVFIVTYDSPDPLEDEWIELSDMWGVQGEFTSKPNNILPVDRDARFARIVGKVIRSNPENLPIDYIEPNFTLSTPARTSSTVYYDSGGTGGGSRYVMKEYYYYKLTAINNFRTTFDFNGYQFNSGSVYKKSTYTAETQNY